MGYGIWQTMAGMLTPNQRYKKNRPTKPRTTSTAPLPPLLALPLELKLQILTYLTDTKHCSLVILRRTHSSFRHIIPRDRITSSPRAIKTVQLVFAEDNLSYLFPHDYYPCYFCFRALPGSKFDFFYTVHGQRYGWKRRKVVSSNRGGIFQGTRRCNDCYVFET